MKKYMFQSLRCWQIEYIKSNLLSLLLKLVITGNVLWGARQRENFNFGMINKDQALFYKDQTLFHVLDLGEIEDNR